MMEPQSCNSKLITAMCGGNVFSSLNPDFTSLQHSGARELQQVLEGSAQVSVVSWENRKPEYEAATVQL